ncbi:inositol-pentakisphosphate 2-kinase [Pterulicium gracile]|uniref:Inositol-pentakisphosphate 2-kinase n=1 Tax=Pterulicium gracile TaxID=1884261 RepID=A0A5C3R3I0_9AGAR|nr:inositol-pentakisphosphate 2-kinase [Pterula gracilis]
MSTQRPHVGSTAASDWKYISEGGATIVFSYVGPSNLLFDDTALRLRKISHDLPLDFSLLEDEEPDDQMIAFQHRCMDRLIPPEHLPHLQSVTVSSEWLKAFAQAKDAERPQKRREKDGIDVCRKKGVLATDLVGGRGLVAEIKPKWGFLSSTRHLSEETRPIKSKTCRFCMHSHLKASEGATVAQKFCPLDLFSKDPERIAVAVESLWSDWVSSEASINNLKVFLNGHKCDPTSDMSGLATSLNVPGDDAEDIKASFVQAVVSILSTTPLLHLLSQLQRNLDALDIEGISSLWAKAHVSSPTGESTVIGLDEEYIPHPNPSIEEWCSFIDLYLSETFQASLDHDNPHIAHLKYYLLAYLLSATLKDCSIILRINPGEGHAMVIDLDPKGLERLHKWEALDRSIVSHYAALDPNARKTCVDDNR